MEWTIVCDSSCDIREPGTDNERIKFISVPFSIRVGDTEFIDDSEINLEDMLTQMSEPETVARTSCPSPGTWYEAFSEGENIIALTISSELSGSYNSALLARKMMLEEYPEKHIEILDTKATGPKAVLAVRSIIQGIDAGLGFDDVVSEAKRALEDSEVVFSLCSFENLVKNGRISRLAGVLAGKLGMWGIGIGNALGHIDLIGKVRGTRRMTSRMLEDMKSRKEKIRSVVISYCENQKLALELKRAISEKWDDVVVELCQARGINSFYAERGGIIVGYR